MIVPPEAILFQFPDLLPNTWHGSSVGAWGLAMADIASVLHTLPPGAQRELLDFAEFLAKKYNADWPEQADWQAMGEQSLAAVWDNKDDDVYAKLLSR